MQRNIGTETGNDINMNDMPLVSIGMPVYNGQKYITKALNAILEQTYTNLEIIISDNGSTDDTQAICLSYANTDKRIRYIRQRENIGPIGNYNFVLQEAQGTFFVWTAADDIRTRDCIEFYQANIGDAGAFYASYSLYNHSLDKTFKDFDPPLLSGAAGKKSEDVIRYFNDICPAMIYGFFRTDLLRTIPFRSIDWSDAFVVTSYIKLYGYKTKISSPKLLSGTANGEYQYKPFNGKFLNPYYFLAGTFKYVFLGGGYLGWFYYIKRMLNVTYISLKFNLFKK